MSLLNLGFVQNHNSYNLPFYNVKNSKKSLHLGSLKQQIFVWKVVEIITYISKWLQMNFLTIDYLIEKLVQLYTPVIMLQQMNK